MPKKYRNAYMGQFLIYGLICGTLYALHLSRQITITTEFVVTATISLTISNTCSINARNIVDERED